MALVKPPGRPGLAGGAAAEKPAQAAELIAFDGNSPVGEDDFHVGLLRAVGGPRLGRPAPQRARPLQALEELPDLLG